MTTTAAQTATDQTIDCDGTCQGCKNDDGCYADPGDVVRNGRIVGRTCTNVDHDHMTMVHPRTAMELDEPIPNTCPDCDLPTHYDSTIEDYVHDALDAEPCFLIQGRPDGATECTS